MASMFILTLIFLFNFSPTMSQTLEISPPTPNNPNELNNLETYIVHLNRPDDGILANDDLTDLDTWYKSFLPANSLASSNEDSRMVYSYHNVITGFAAKLSPEEVKEIEKKDGFVSANPQKIYSVHTTHSPNFLGLHQNLGFWKDSNFGKGMIIGVLDTGIAPNHPSFNDEGMPPPPTKWKGKCEFNTSTACNNKLIGARSFIGGVAGPPIDEDGHGTHTASTAAGNFVRGANVLGNANGTAAGIAPLAHVAMYKVCSLSCADSDILAAMDTAIEDGVDVLSISLGGFPDPFYAEVIALGAFRVIEKGIFVSCSAGNSGPFNASVSNDAPWLLTVGASTIDRTLQATAKLGNGEEYDGESAFQPYNFSSMLLPLVYAGTNGTLNAAFCGSGSFNNTDIKGKVVVCEMGGGVRVIQKGQIVKDAGGAAMILVNRDFEGYSTTAESHVLPATSVNYIAGQNIKSYINSTATPTATILFKGTIIGEDNAPMIASFSSRGPSRNSPGILKPDIIGPGVSILAAWPFSLNNITDMQSTFNMISGTSMSCPHLSGVAALLKSVHPDWSPAAIKSAIMTTADLQNLNGKPIIDERLLPADIFAIGSGHVNPSRANDPGLVYDIKSDDYIPYLCGLNYTNRQVGVIVQRRVNCTEESSILEAQLNYPSFSISLGSSAQTYMRTVTNVGEANSTYTVEIVPPPGVAVVVTPGRLEFSQVNQKMTFEVRFNRIGGGVSTQYVQGFLTWGSGKHIVRSPISVKLE